MGQQVVDLLLQVAYFKLRFKVDTIVVLRTQAILLLSLQHGALESSRYQLDQVA